MRALPLLLLIACAPDAPSTGSDAGSVNDAGPSIDGGAWSDAGIDNDAGPAEEPPNTIGGDRPVRVVYPADFDPSERWPLLVVLHGYTASGSIQDSYLGISARADQFGFITIAPDGLHDAGGNRHWNATEACCDFGGAGNDDLGYITGLIDEAVARASVDPERVMVIGHSNGGFMANRLACDAADKISAVLNLAGSGLTELSDCQPSRPINYVHVHGTFDATVRYGGGTLTAGGPSYPGVDALMADWRRRNDCGPSHSNGQLNYDSAVLGDETEVTVWDCGETEVALWKMVGSGHIPGLTASFRNDAVATLMGLISR